MLFVEFRFLFFFAAVLIVHWGLLRKNLARKVFLLLVSYAFYAGWDWRFLGLIWFSTIVDWFAGAGIYRHQGSPDAPGNRRAQRAWLAVSLVCNLGMLGTFKYFDFFSESAEEFLAWLGIGASLPVLNVALPVGISFYTFQTLSYSLDIYFGKLKPSRSLLNLALFVGFFPQLVAGPIVLAKEFLGQLDSKRTRAMVPVQWALVLFFVGFVKKSCLSDSLSPFVDAVNMAPEGVTAFQVWLSTFSFSIQLYCDFSGYTDMAIACAALLGYRLPKNFDAPYLSRSLSEIWKRWHITLGRWFFQYVYVPMGGNRKGTFRSLWNLWVIFALSGLWHGAGYNYVLFGMLHGLFMVLERLPVGRWIHRLPPLLGVLYVQFVWIVALTLFRAQSIGDAGVLINTMLTGRSGPLPDGVLTPPTPGWIFPTLIGSLVVHLVWQFGHLERRWSELSPIAFGATMGAAVALALPWISTNPAPYIYFAF